VIALQAPRIARARGIAIRDVLDLIDVDTSGRTLGFIGEPDVNAPPQPAFSMTVRSLRQSGH
jgi:K+-transporting ATPase c subunit